MSKTATKRGIKVSRNGHSNQPISVKMEIITPDVAGDLLAKNVHNRKLSAAAVKRVAEAMVRGEWKPENGETVKIATDGALLDGQHRVAGVVMADIPVKMLVARNVPLDTFDTIDTGRPRRMADFLFVSGESQNERELANALAGLYRYKRLGNFQAQSQRGVSASPQQLFAVLGEHPKLRESLAPARVLKRRLPQCNQTVAAILHYLMTKINKSDADFFFSALESGAGLLEDDPIYRLRERLISSHVHLKDANDMGALMIKAWNAYRTKRSIKALTWRNTGTRAEGYPEPL